MGQESIETIHAPSVRPFPDLSSVQPVYLGPCKPFLHSIQLAKGDADSYNQASQAGTLPGGAACVGGAKAMVDSWLPRLPLVANQPPHAHKPSGTLASAGGRGTANHNNCILRHTCRHQLRLFYLLNTKSEPVGTW